MKGLFVKDLRILLRRKQQLLIFAVVCAIIGFSIDGSFIVPYATILMGTFAMGTLGFDEYDNGFPFIFSLPTTIKKYVTEKYLFCLLAELVGFIVGVAIYFIASKTKGITLQVEDLLVISTAIPIGLVFIAGSLLIQMKYGMEKSRTIMFVVYGIMFGGIALIVKFLPAEKMASLDSLSPAAVSSGLIVIGAIVYIVLYMISLKIMQNKES